MPLFDVHQPDNLCLLNGSWLIDADTPEQACKKVRSLLKRDPKTIDSMFDRTKWPEDAKLEATELVFEQSLHVGNKAGRCAYHRSHLTRKREAYLASGGR